MKNVDFFKNISRELHPKSKLFLSADLVNSSSQKRAMRGSPVVKPDEVDEIDWEREVALDPVLNAKNKFLDDTWVSYITEFYQKFQDIFKAELNHVLRVDETLSDGGGNGVCGKLKSSDVKVWRLAGDEVIFTVDVVSPEQIFALCTAFVRAIIGYRKILYNDFKFFEKNPNSHYSEYRDWFGSRYNGCILDVKGAIWWAGFPISNREVFFSSQLEDVNEVLSAADPRFRNFFVARKAIERNIINQHSFVVDYIGPSIDVGFRLADLAKPNRAPISAEVAYFLTKCDLVWKEAIQKHARDRGSLRKALNVRFIERRPLRGVFGLKPYPVFALDSASEEGLSVIEDGIGGRGKSEDLELERYFEILFERNERYVNKPELINMESPFDERSVLCKLIKEIDDLWQLEWRRLEDRLLQVADST